MKTIEVKCPPHHHVGGHTTIVTYRDDVDLDPPAEVVFASLLL